MRNFNHQGNYKCECGKEFDNSQAFNGHKSHCKIHQIAQHGSLDVLNKAKEKQINKLKEYYKPISEKISLENSIKEQRELDQ